MGSEDFKVEVEVAAEEVAVPTALPVVTFPQIRWEWDEEDQAVIEEIIKTVNAQVAEKFRPAFQTVQKVLLRVRIPETDEYGNERHDENGKIVWRRNPDGSVIEHWGNIGAEEMDEFILNASMYTFFASQEEIDLYAEAVFAKFASEDTYDDFYRSLGKGTINDKTAEANRATREERYFAFYKSYTYKKVKELVTRLDTLVRRVESVRNMQLKDAERNFRANRNM